MKGTHNPFLQLGRVRLKPFNHHTNKILPQPSCQRYFRVQPSQLSPHSYSQSILSFTRRLDSGISIAAPQSPPQPLHFGFSSSIHHRPRMMWSRNHQFRAFPPKLKTQPPKLQTQPPKLQPQPQPQLQPRKISLHRHYNILPRSVILVCIALYIYELWAVYRANQGDTSHLEFIKRNFISNLTNYREGRWWTLLTPTLMHASLSHILLNMFGLVSIGRLIGAVFGPGTFLITWIGAGLCGSAASLITAANQEKKITEQNKKAPFYQRPQQIPERNSVGASGSICGLIAVGACYAPHLHWTMMMIPIPIPGWIVLAGGAAFSVGAFVNEWIPSIGHDAHLGGMVFGVIYYYALLRGRKGVMNPAFL